MLTDACRQRLLRRTLAYRTVGTVNDSLDQSSTQKPDVNLLVENRELAPVRGPVRILPKRLVRKNQTSIATRW